MVKKKKKPEILSDERIKQIQIETRERIRRTHFNASEMKGNTYLELDEVMEIVDKTLKTRLIGYTLVVDASIKYITEFEMTNNEPAWMFTIKYENGFLDSITWLFISDFTGEPVYLCGGPGYYTKL